MMTAKFVILNAYATETKQGIIRIEETRHQNAITMLSQYGGVLRLILKSRNTVISLGIMLIMSICSMALINPMLDSMVAVTVVPEERARIMSVLYVIVILFTSPFGWVAGVLSEISRVLPFFMNIILFVIGAILTAFINTGSNTKAAYKI